MSSIILLGHHIPLGTSGKSAMVARRQVIDKITVHFVAILKSETEGLAITNSLSFLFIFKLLMI